MIHHIKNTIEGVIYLLSGTTMIAISLTDIDVYVRVAAGIFGSLASVCAAIYYIDATRRGKKK
jgi:hypothetical protein